MSRYLFVQWSDGEKSSSRTITVARPASYTAKDKVQFQLVVKSDYGDPKGSVWYDAGSEARFSVATSVEGPLGIKYVFERWSGDSTATMASVTIVMNGPKTVTAIWRTDYTMTVAIIAVIAVVAIALVVVAMKRREKATAA
ncbi:hypothetical protein KEJ51_06175 [Candidatus Bathyarchaeota archaeon]|nr:hypothetical protein [Candidatus Bathyarchaeota archaeon]